jgi:HTH-type transcriptional regulator, transcriptional repressor of NAD biosynthesis genes
VIRGLVIGRFYPPHRGHKFLIDTALAQVDYLDVLVCSRPEQTISGELRRDWLREIHPTAHVRAIYDPGEDDNSKFWAEYTVQILGRAPDVVFTSEHYGEMLAHFLGCRHVMVDRERVHVPISASAILAAPLKHWEFLDPCVRGHFAKRISVIGAESTGKTRLARELAEHYQTVSVREYARQYCEKLQNSGVDLWTYPWRSDEFTEIARRQQAIEDKLAREANRILICDTDVLATSIWHERYLHTRSAEVESLVSSHRHDLYLLTDIDVPFVQDGMRDGESIRPWMNARFEQVLKERNLPWVKISGFGRERLDRAVKEVDKLLA